MSYLKPMPMSQKHKGEKQVPKDTTNYSSIALFGELTYSLNSHLLDY